MTTRNINNINNIDIDNMINDYICGMAMVGIAKKWRTKERFIWKIFKKEIENNNIKLINYKPSNPPQIKGHLKSSFIDMYIRSDKTTFQISTSLFLKCRAVQSLIIHNQLPLRTVDKLKINDLYENELIRAFEISKKTFLPYRMVNEYVQKKYKCPSDRYGNTSNKTTKKEKPINPYFLKRGKISQTPIFQYY